MIETIAFPLNHLANLPHPNNHFRTLLTVLVIRQREPGETAPTERHMIAFRSTSLRSTLCALGVLPRLLLLALLMQVTFAPTLVSAQSNYQPEQIKAALLFKFAKLIGWPEESLSSEHFTFGVLGDPTFATTLSGLVDGKTISGKPVTVRLFTFVKEVERCNVLFVSEGAYSELPTLVQRFPKGILFVGDGEALLSQGGVIGFLFKDDRFRFSLNVRNAKRYNLVLSRELQSLAETLME